jgi:deazaflavin-dependent oxidoreductase (nitroreductase family)
MVLDRAMVLDTAGERGDYGAMTFDTPAGTRGGRQPGGGALYGMMQKQMMKQIRRKGKVMGADGVVLTTIGAKTGAERTTPVMSFPGKDGSWLIVASAAGGQRNPAYYYNIAAHPDRVQIEMAGQKVAVTAEQLHGAKRDEAWQQITAASSRFAKYQQKTDRQIPVIRLTRRAG